MMNNAIALLEECLINGDKGSLILYEWFKGERSLIESTVKELNFNNKEIETKDYYVDCSRIRIGGDVLQEVTKEQIDNAMLIPGEYKEENGKFYIKPGMLDGYICNEYYKMETK